MDHLVEKDTKLNGTYEPEINTDDELNNTVKKVVIDESKNTIHKQEAPPAPTPAPAPTLKPDTPKIPLPQTTYKFLLVDTLTDSTIGIYKSNQLANNVVKKLIKDDLQIIINNERLKIILGESVDDNRNSLANIKHCLYQFNTIDQSSNTMLSFDGKNINRYKIMCVMEGVDDVDETNFYNI
jgi:hypothetical protein